MPEELRGRWFGLVERTVHGMSLPGVEPRRVAEEARGIAANLWLELDRAYDAAERHYHTWQHVGECLTWLDRFTAGCTLPDGPGPDGVPSAPGTPDGPGPDGVPPAPIHRLCALEWAIYYHDVVYRTLRSPVPKGGTTSDETLSADRAETALQKLGAPAAFIAKVRALIEATDHLRKTGNVRADTDDHGPGKQQPDHRPPDHRPPNHRPSDHREYQPHWSDQDVMADIDVAILGAPMDRYDQYEEQIRREFSVVPADRFRVGRLEVLESFLSRRRIYRTPFFYDLLERNARANLGRVVTALNR